MQRASFPPRAARLRGRARALAAAVIALPFCAASGIRAQTATEPAAPVVAGVRTDSLPRVSAGAQVKPPPARITLLFNRRTSFVVVTDTQRATRLRIVQATLQEGTGGALLSPSYLRLCVEGRCGETVNLRPRAATRVDLAVDPSFRHNGTFTGSVYLASDESPAGFSPFELTVLSSTRTARNLGAALVLAGILVGVLVTVILRQRALRLQALLPAKRLADAVARLRVAVQGAEKVGETAFPQTRDRLERLALEVTEPSLQAQGFVPGRFAPVVPAMDRSAEYGELLKRVAEEVGIVQLVLARGIRPIAAMWPEHQHPAIKTALRNLDPVAAHAEKADAAAAAVAQIRTKLDADLGVVRAEAVAVEDVPLPAVHAVQIAFQRTNAAIWLIWALVTWVTGVVALIATQYAFGAGLDYYKCFLWGIGVQIAGNQLQQLTPASVATAFSISLPKS